MPVEPSRPGTVACMKCQKPFDSPDRLRIRRCPKCKKDEDAFSPRVVRLVDVRGAINQYYRRGT